MFSRLIRKSSATPAQQPHKKVELEYEDLLKVEFLDMLDKFQSDREKYHIYAIGRCATTATLVGFSYSYSVMESNDGSYIIQTIDLAEYGKLEFEIRSGEHYGTIITDNRVSVIQNMLSTFPTHTKVANFTNSKIN